MVYWGSTDPIRFHITVKHMADLRARLRVVGSRDGRLRWPGSERMLPRGRPAEIEITVQQSHDTIHLFGSVDRRRDGELPGAWLSIPDAMPILDNCEAGMVRRHQRVPSDYLALIPSKRGGQVLCRLRDIGEGGARLLVASDDAGQAGSTLRVSLLEAGPQGRDLDVDARIAWAHRDEAGLAWCALDDLARQGLARLLRLAHHPWQLALVG